MPVPSRSSRRSLEREVAAADAVIIHNSLYLTSLSAARYAAKHNKPWLLVQHIGSIPFSNALLRLVMSAANALVTRPLLARAPQSVFISDAVRAFFAGSDSTSSAALLLNGVDHELFHPPTQSDRNRLRKKFSVGSGRRQILFVGRFVEKKGLNTIRAIAAEHGDWDLWLVGDGPIDPRGWGYSNVHVLGRLDRKELADRYKAADALVLPSVGEGFPLVIQEAMASGLPIVCGLDSAAADPQAKHLLSALDVDPSDPVGTARRFAIAIAEAPDAPDGRLAAHARIAYDWDANAAWIDNRLRELALGQQTGG